MIGGADVGGSDAPPLLQARQLHKSYGSVQALRGASFDVAAGEVVALIGDNGAGKSTLVKCLTGVERPVGDESTWVRCLTRPSRFVPDATPGVRICGSGTPCALARTASRR